MVEKCPVEKENYLRLVGKKMGIEQKGIHKLSVADIIEAAGGKLLRGEKKFDFKALSIDSRTITPGGIFLAVKGEKFDGHEFINEAFKKGAKGAIVSKKIDNQENRDFPLVIVDDTQKALGDIAAFWRSRFKVQIVAITGSNGKTTTKEMVANTLGVSHNVLKNEGNLNNLIGLPLTLLRLNKKHECAVLEMGMNVPGEIERLTEIADPQVGLITNIHEAHIEGLKDIRNVAKAKSELLQRMDRNSTAVLNIDDSWVMKVSREFHGKKITFGFAPGADVRMRNGMYQDNNETHVEFVLQNINLPLKLKIFGKHMVYNALAAAACALASGISADDIKKGLESFSPYKMRFEITDLNNGAHLINDAYNANPRSVEASLKTLVEIKKRGRGIAVLGDMLELGELSEKAHFELGILIADLGIDYLCVIGKFAQYIADGAREGNMKGKISVCDSKAKISEEIKKIIKKDDWILVKGSRKMRMEDICESLMSSITD